MERNYIKSIKNITLKKYSTALPRLAQCDSVPSHSAYLYVSQDGVYHPQPQRLTPQKPEAAPSYVHSPTCLNGPSTCAINTLPTQSKRRHLPVIALKERLRSSELLARSAQAPTFLVQRRGQLQQREPPVGVAATARRKCGGGVAFVPRGTKRSQSAPRRVAAARGRNGPCGCQPVIDSTLSLNQLLYAGRRTRQEQPSIEPEFWQQHRSRKGHIGQIKAAAMGGTRPGRGGKTKRGY